VMLSSYYNRLIYMFKTGIRRIKHDKFYMLLLFPAGLILGIFLMILMILVSKSIPIFRLEGLSFILKNSWHAVEGKPEEEFYGIAAALFGTFYVGFLSLLISTPIAVSWAIILGEFLSGHSQSIVSSLLEFASGMPTVLYGLWGALFLTRFLKRYVMEPIYAKLHWVPIFSTKPTSGFTMMSACIILALMITPIQSLIMFNAYRLIPQTYTEALYALGLTRGEVVRFKLKLIRPTIILAGLIGFSRAIGETIAVSLVIGNSFYLGLSIFAPGYTIPSLIASQFGNCGLYAYMENALYASALILLLLGFIFHYVIMLVDKRARWYRI